MKDEPFWMKLKMGFEKEGLIRMEYWNPRLGKYGDAYFMGKMLD